MHQAPDASCGILYYLGFITCPFYAIKYPVKTRASVAYQQTARQPLPPLASSPEVLL